MRENGGGKMPRRCGWVDEGSELYARYHDEEWGVPVHEDGRLFEMLLLESFQAGLSWIGILKKRENFRRAFDGFDPEKIARYDEKKVDRLLQDAGIVRNRSKIMAAIGNAAAFLQIQKEYGSFDRYLWSFTGERTLCGSFGQGPPPARTELSDAISADLRKRGMKYVGSVIIYSYLQAVGVVNDHEPGCFLHPGRGEICAKP